MNWMSVESSNIDKIAYKESEQELLIKFKNSKGQHYKFKGVELTVLNDLILAESKGKFFAEKIKGKYDFEKVEGEE